MAFPYGNIALRRYILHANYCGTRVFDDPSLVLQNTKNCNIMHIQMVYLYIYIFFAFAALHGVSWIAGRWLAPPPVGLQGVL